MYFLHNSSMEVPVSLTNAKVSPAIKSVLSLLHRPAPEAVPDKTIYRNITPKITEKHDSSDALASCRISAALVDIRYFDLRHISCLFPVRYHLLCNFAEHSKDRKQQDKADSQDDPPYMDKACKQEAHCGYHCNYSRVLHLCRYMIDMITLCTC